MSEYTLEWLDSFHQEFAAAHCPSSTLCHTRPATHQPLSHRETHTNPRKRAHRRHATPYPTHAHTHASSSSQHILIHSSRTHTHTHTHARTHRHTQLPLIYTDTHTHTHTHSYLLSTQTRTHTHTHTHTRSLQLPKIRMAFLTCAFSLGVLLRLIEKALEALESVGGRGGTPPFSSGERSERSVFASGERSERSVFSSEGLMVTIVEGAAPVLID